jgi:predicted MPP superfamily phosphohydrolase
MVRFQVEAQPTDYTKNGYQAARMGIIDNGGRKALWQNQMRLEEWPLMGSAVDSELVAELVQARRGPWFMFRGPLGFEWNQVRLPVPGLAKELEGFRFVHLSDLHMRGTWSRGYDALIERLNQSAPDLLLITGDFLNDQHEHRPGLRTLKRLLPRLKARLGAYAILGNHDVDLLEPYLREMGVTLLDGRRALLESGEAKLELIGLGGVARHDLDAHFIAAQPPKEPGTLRIVLSHYPDHFRRIRPLNADIFLAGHTHGGQICLPGGWPIITHDRMPRRYAKGVHRLDRTWYIVSRGFGFAGIPVRFNCPAEVAQITLAPAKPG